MVGATSKDLLVITQQVVVPADDRADHLVQRPYLRALKLRRWQFVSIGHVQQHERGLYRTRVDAQADICVEVRHYSAGILNRNSGISQEIRLHRRRPAGNLYRGCDLLKLTPQIRKRGDERIGGGHADRSLADPGQAAQLEHEITGGVAGTCLVTLPVVEGPEPEEKIGGYLQRRTHRSVGHHTGGKHTRIGAGVSLPVRLVIEDVELRNPLQASCIDFAGIHVNSILDWAVKPRYSRSDHRCHETCILLIAKILGWVRRCGLFVVALANRSLIFEPSM